MHRTYVEEAVNAAGIGIWEWNLKTEQNYVSETWARMLGYSQEELSTISFLQMSELVHPEERHLLQREVNQSLGPDHIPLDLTMRMRHKQGHWVWVQAKGGVVSTENGEPSRMAGVHLNVSNIMDKLELHRSAHTALDRVISSAPVVIYTLQPKPPYYASYISDNLASVMDVPVSEAGFGQVLRPCHEHQLKHPSFATWVRNNQEHELIRTYQAETRSGDIIWVRDYCHKVFHDGELRYISGALIDITDQVEQETILKQIASVSPGIIYQFIRYADGRMGFPFISERVKDIFNVPANHFRSDPGYLFENMPPEDYEAMLKTIESSARDLSPFEQQFRARVNGELRWFQAASVPERTPKGDVLWNGLAIDITEQKATESYLEQAKQRLELAQEVARIGYWEGNLATREVSWSALVYEIYGLKPELHQPSFELFNELVHPDDRQKVAASEDIARKTGKQDMTHRIIRPDGEMRWLHQLAYLHDDQVLLGTVYDITETKLLELELREQSSIDPLTRLHNRRYFMDEGTKAIARALRTQQPMALLTMDLDNFKRVNDSYGHGVGDEVLKTLADTAKSSFRGTDIVARIGGEEFVVLLDNTHQHAAGPVADKFRERFGAIEHTAPDGSSFQVTVSIGIACLQVGREDLSELDTLMRQSDEALYQAKHNGRNRVELYVAS